MKKYLLVAVMLCLPSLVFARSNGSYSVITKYGNETSINYRRTSEPQKWYVAAHADLSFLSWKNEYKYGVSGSDNFDFKPVLGADIALGLEFNKRWRADLELGYVGSYHEQETEYITNYLTEKTDFDLHAMYTTVNGYYNFGAGVYAGLGVGAAFVEASVNHTALANKSKAEVSPMGAVMLGLTSRISEKTYFDIRYRLSAFSGPTFYDLCVKIKVGWITDNSVSVGLRYEF